MRRKLPTPNPKPHAPSLAFFAGPRDHQKKPV